MTLYLLFSVLIFGALAMIWERTTLLNFGLKVIFTIMSLAGFVLFLMDLGFVVKG